MPGIPCQKESKTAFDPVLWLPSLRPHTADSQSLEVPKQLLNALFDGTLTLPTEVVPQPQDETWFDGSAVDDSETAQTINGDRHNPALLPGDDQVLEHLSSDSSLYSTLHGLDQFILDIDSAILRLGGVVSPKLGTVAPSDATWVSFHRSMRCESATEVLMLLSASERVMQYAEEEPSPILILRAWIDGMDRATEYRVFVSSNEVVGMSQRDPSVPSRLTNTDMNRTVRLVETQFDRVIRSIASTWIGTASKEKYVYDVFVDRNWRVWVLDFCAWGEPTAALLYEWDELEEHLWMSSVSRRAQLRSVSPDSSLRPSQTLYDGIPIELRNSNAGEALADAARRLTLRDSDEILENNSKTS
jgi:hypothetical protein